MDRTQSQSLMLQSALLLKSVKSGFIAMAKGLNSFSKTYLQGSGQAQSIVFTGSAMLGFGNAYIMANKVLTGISKVTKSIKNIKKKIQKALFFTPSPYKKYERMVKKGFKDIINAIKKRSGEKEKKKSLILGILKLVGKKIIDALMSPIGMILIGIGIATAAIRKLIKNYFQHRAENEAALDVEQLYENDEDIVEYDDSEPDPESIIENEVGDTENLLIEDIPEEDGNTENIKPLSSAERTRLSSKVKQKLKKANYSPSTSKNIDPKVVFPMNGPVKGNYSVSSGFGTRIHPITGKVQHHSGIDIKVPVGTKVYAPHTGVVDKIWDDTTHGGGLSVRVKYTDESGNVRTSGFAHLSDVLVKEGQQISTTTPIALSGNSGRSTGAHLHWTERVNGKAVDPMSVYSTVPASVPDNSIDLANSNNIKDKQAEVIQLANQLNEVLHSEEAMKRIMKVYAKNNPNYTALIE